MGINQILAKKLLRYLILAIALSTVNLHLNLEKRQNNKKRTNECPLRIYLSLKFTI